MSKTIKSKREKTFGEFLETDEGKQELANRLTEFIAPHIPAIQKAFEELKVLLTKALPYIHNLAENIKAYPDFSKLMLSEFHKRSWYIIPQAPADIVFKISELLSAGKFDEIDNLMSVIVSKNLKKIEDNICSSHPEREILIREAFQNHHDGRYASAILMIFSQVDGITNELLEVSFYSKKSGRPVSAMKIKEILGIDQPGETPFEIYQRKLAYSFLEPLLVVGGVSENTDVVELLFPEGVNRHSALHGIKSDYGTKINSLKSISLLSYLTGIAKKTIEDAKNI